MRKGLLILLVVLLTVSGAALAQEMPPVLCGDLSEEDCAILEQSQASMAGLTAASSDFSLDVVVEAEGQTIPISLTGSGTFSGVTPMEHMGDMTEMPAVEDVLAMLRDFNGELILNLTVPESMAAGDGFPNSLSLELRLVDGVGYVNFDTLQPLINDDSLSGWGGLDIAGMVGALMEEFMTPEMMEQFEDMAAMSGANVEMMAQFSDPEFIGQYMTITRTDDGSGATATFATTIDFAGFFADPAFEEMMREQIAAQAEMQGSEEISEADMDLAMGMVGKMFEEVTMVVTQEIDTATGYLVNMEFNMDMDLSEMAEMSGENSDPVTVSVSMTVDYSYDDIPTITAPEDATILPYERLIGMLMGMAMPDQS